MDKEIATRIEVQREYADMLKTMLLCNEFNPDSNKALKRCLRQFKKRYKTSEIRSMCSGLLKTKKITTTQWLEEKVAELEEVMPIINFFQLVRSENYMQ